MRKSGIFYPIESSRNTLRMNRHTLVTAKGDGNGNLEQTTCIYQLFHCKHLHYLWIAESYRAVLRLTHYNIIHVHCLRNWNGQLLS